MSRRRTISKQTAVSPGLIALIYIGLGKNDKAIAWLVKAYQQHSPMMSWLKVDPRFDSLRQDARFQDLMQRVGLL